ncbi:MAG TPA: hypothetical protein VJ032_09695, partial [Thermoanaerobaculia bacterium]|nr:hypothetical protein [Thermoanaerobaculia bacterium]
MQFADVLAIVAAFNRESVHYKVIGGVATNLHGIPRATEDADFLIDPAAANVAAMKRALRSIWDDPHVDEIRDDDMLSEFPLLTYRAPDAAFCVNF